MKLSIVNKNRNKFDSIAATVVVLGGLVISFLNSSLKFESYLKSTWSIVLLGIITGANFYYFFLKKLLENKSIMNNAILICSAILVLALFILGVMFKVKHGVNFIPF